MAQFDSTIANMLRQPITEKRREETSKIAESRGGNYFVVKKFATLDLPMGERTGVTSTGPGAKPTSKPNVRRTMTITIQIGNTRITINLTAPVLLTLAMPLI